MQGDTGRDLCFLLGFPRSGTTLLDTFLNAHPDIDSIEEHPTLERVIEDLRQAGRPYTASLPQLAADEVFRLRAMYRQELTRYQSRPSKLVLDKLPLRSINAGLITRLFPEARILFALRHPCDVVLSNFMQQYAENEAFIHFDTLADSAAMYDRVFSLWRDIESTLSPDLLYTRYEDLVREPQLELQRVCTFLGVTPTAGMLDLKERLNTRDRIRTNSYQQVAEPVYQRSVNRWKNYSEQLQPVLPLLQPYIEGFGYEA